MDSEEYFCNYINEKDPLDQFLLARSHQSKKDKDDDKDEEKIEVSATLVYGVTVSLVGFFIMLLPFPGCNDWGKRILFWGLSATGGCLSQQSDQNRKDEKEKNKNGK